jgi:raffinose/stachyose/melibiose transport system permease protein
MFFQYGWCLIAIVILVPLAATFISGFKTNNELNASPFSLSLEWQWGNYVSILQSTTFWQQLWNSSIVMTAPQLGYWCFQAWPYLFCTDEFSWP